MSPAEHWRQLAAEARRKGEWDQQMVGSGVAAFNKAAMYERTAEALDREATTGKSHCVCCLKPLGRDASHAVRRDS